jgi:O-antigen/teichoic acid export membrane protein
MTSAETEELGKRAGWGAVTLALRTLLQVLIALARVALVARLLSPEQLGIYGMLVVAVEAARALTSVGLHAVVVQRPSVDRALINTYWVFSVGQGAAMAMLVLLAAPLLQGARAAHSFFHLQLLVAASVLVSGWQSPGRLLAEREARFGRLAVAEIVVTILDAVVVIGLAAWLRTATALALASVVRACVEVALSFVLFPAEVRLRAERQPARELFAASGHFVVLALGSYVTIYGDNGAVGTLLGTHALGLYVVAYQLAQMPFSPLFAVTKRLLFPVLSRLQTHTAALRSVVLDTTYAQFVVLLPLAVGMSWFADLLVPLLYGPAYVEAVDVLRALILVSVGRGLANIVGPALLAAGRYAFLSRIKWVEVVVFVPAVLFGIHLWGVVGAALGAGASYLLSGALHVTAVRREHRLPLLQVARALGVPALTAAVAVAIGHGFERATANRWCTAATFAVAYIAATALTQRGRVTEVLGFFRGARASG